MGGLSQSRFVCDLAELDEQRFAAKLRACPRCRQLGTVNAHGFLRGYSESGEFGIVRGRRFFCSNRGSRPGCGRTFSVLIRTFVSRFAVTAFTLAGFVLAAIAGLSVAAAWARAAQSRLSRSTGFRLWRRVVSSQIRWRSLLLHRGQPPPSPDHRPLAQLVEHMKKWTTGPQIEFFADFQHEFQSDLFH